MIFSKIIFIFSFWIFCFNFFMIEQSLKNTAFSFQESDSLKLKGDTIYKVGNLSISGDSNAFKKIKITQYCSSDYRFYDYPVLKQKLVPAPINFKTDVFALANKKIFLDQYKRKGINFAGHYSLLWLGKEGERYLEAIVVDVKNGSIYHAPSAENLGAFYTDKPNGIRSGYKFKRNSRLLIVNPIDSSASYNILQLKNANKIYLWNERFKKFETLN